MRIGPWIGIVTAGVIAGALLPTIALMLRPLIAGRGRRRFSAAAVWAAIISYGPFLDEILAGRSMALALLWYVMIGIVLTRVKRTQWRNGLLMGALAGLLWMTRFDAAPIVVALGAVFPFTWRRGRALTWIAGYAIAVGVLILPWILYSRTVFGVAFASDNAMVAKSAVDNFVNNWYPVFPPTLREAPTLWLARVLHNVPGLAAAVWVPHPDTPRRPYCSPYSPCGRGCKRATWLDERPPAARCSPGDRPVRAAARRTADDGILRDPLLHADLPGGVTLEHGAAAADAAVARRRGDEDARRAVLAHDGVHGQPIGLDEVADVGTGDHARLSRDERSGERGGGGERQERGKRQSDDELTNQSHLRCSFKERAAGAPRRFSALRPLRASLGSTHLGEESRERAFDGRPRARVNGAALEGPMSMKHPGRHHAKAAAKRRAKTAALKTERSARAPARRGAREQK